MKMTPNFTSLNPANLAGDFAAQLRMMLSDGRLNPGDKLPSSRKLATELNVARGTIVAGLDTLIAEGFLESRHGSGTYVSLSVQPGSLKRDFDTLPPVGKVRFKPAVDQDFTGPLNFQACRPSMEVFPQQAWRKAMADAASRKPSPDYGDPQGELELRIAIASYLCRARGLDVNPDQILITNGAINAIQLIARLYVGGGEVVAFENPGYPLARQIFELEGGTILPVNVDQSGLIIDEIAQSEISPKLIYVTPSHQFPTGARLSLKRRQSLIEWARQNDALILEDDYDGEFRYDIAPLPPMAAMTASGFVMYLGTFSKTMFPGLRLGYAAGDRKIIQQLTALRTAQDYQTNTLSQIALARFISNSEFEKHVHKMRRIYAKKRQVLRVAISENEFPGELVGIDSGLNALIRLRTDLSATNISARAKLRDMSIPPISQYYAGEGSPDNSLVFGYAACSEQQIIDGVATLAELVRQSNTERRL